MTIIRKDNHVESYLEILEYYITVNCHYSFHVFILIHRILCMMPDFFQESKKKGAIGHFNTSFLLSSSLIFYSLPD